VPCRLDNTGEDSLPEDRGETAIPESPVAMRAAAGWQAGRRRQPVWLLHTFDDRTTADGRRDAGYRRGVSPTSESELGAKGAGEAATAGAAAAVANAVNDALRPFGASVTEIPLTPQVILTALGRI